MKCGRVAATDPAHPIATAAAASARANEGPADRTRPAIADPIADPVAVAAMIAVSVAANA
jgi:hypothetical protein